MRGIRALCANTAHWVLVGLFGLRGFFGLAFVRRVGMAPLAFLRPCSRGDYLELRDIQPSGLNVRGKRSGCCRHDSNYFAAAIQNSAEVLSNSQKIYEQSLTLHTRNSLIFIWI